MMKISIKKTNEILRGEWESYTQSYNTVFRKKNTDNDFKHKYLTTIDGVSYHALLTEEERVVGGCTIIPYEYYIGGEIIRAGLAVDVFILENYRSDPYSLYNMYKDLKTEIIARDISIVIAVPNDTVYPYWKSVVKWKDVGLLKYYALPVRSGNVISKMPGILNRISFAGTKIILASSFFFISTESLSPIRLRRSDSVTDKQRYTADHTLINRDNTFFSYRIVNEKGVKTCYLIDFYNQKKKMKDTFSLHKAIQYICKREDIDLIIFIGKLSFFQVLLFRVPFRSEPRHLYFMADILIPEKTGDPELIFNMANWDFSLFNFDVR
jgi:hypothetical protein